MKILSALLLITWAPMIALGCVSYSVLRVEPFRGQYVTDSYQKGTNCRWHSESARGSKITMTCENNPNSKSSTTDCLSIYHAGELDWSDVHHFCGAGMFTITSVGNQMDILIFTGQGSRGGSFACNLTVINSPPPIIKDLKKEEADRIIPPTDILSGSKPNTLSAQTRPVTRPLNKPLKVGIPIDPKSCKCGWTNPEARNRITRHVVEGVETQINEFPMMAAVIDLDQQMLVCGATIIAQQTVLTAAHCLQNRVPSKIAILVGDHDTSKGNETDAVDLIMSQTFVSHPQYNSESYENDIALVRLKRKIKYSDKVGPACLPFSHVGNSFEEKKVQAVGWGATGVTSGFSKYLQKVTLNIVSQQTCRKSFPQVTPSHICSYGRYKDTCQGDSGGPLLWDDGKRTHVLGIVSYGNHCASDAPSVNTRVTDYLSWIMKNVDKNEFCDG